MVLTGCGGNRPLRGGARRRAGGEAAVILPEKLDIGRRVPPRVAGKPHVRRCLRIA